MSSPWAKISQPDPVKLDDIMSEEVAKDLQEKELVNYQKAISDPGAIAALEVASILDDIPPELLEEGLDSDEKIAKMLQQQYDKEYDEMLNRTEKKYNGTSKISISFSNYRRMPMNEDFESDSEEEELEDLRDRKDWDRFDNVQRDFQAIPPCGYHIKDGGMVTKHDLAMNSRRNACRMMSFPPEFETGDGACFDLKLSNKVFNSLKAHSKHEEARRHKLHDKKEDRATAEFGLDEFTRLLLYKMINNQLLERVNGVISIGKEAVVLHAETDPSYPEGDHTFPKECVIKVFKTTLSEFKQRDKYIKDDHRFKDRMRGEQSSRKTVQLWAEKEMRNLNRLNKAQIPSPVVLALKNHVLVMSFIGENHVPAPKLKNIKLSMEDYIIAYDQIVETMKNLYKKANLIHADLSEYNILYHNGQCYIIDVSQAVEPNHENAFHFLMRDCKNIYNFFTKRGVPEVFTPEALFQEITDFDFGDKLKLLEVQERVKMKPHLVGSPGIESTHSFDNAWEQSKMISTDNKLPSMAESAIVDPIVA